jgi:hypothetical protein
LLQAAVPARADLTLAYTGQTLTQEPCSAQPGAAPTGINCLMVQGPNITGRVVLTGPFPARFTGAVTLSSPPQDTDSHPPGIALGFASSLRIDIGQAVAGNQFGNLEFVFVLTTVQITFDNGVPKSWKIVAIDPSVCSNPPSEALVENDGGGVTDFVAFFDQSSIGSCASSTLFSGANTGTPGKLTAKITPTAKSITLTKGAYLRQVQVTGATPGTGGACPRTTGDSFAAAVIYPGPGAAGYAMTSVLQPAEADGFVLESDSLEKSGATGGLTPPAGADNWGTTPIDVGASFWTSDSSTLGAYSFTESFVIADATSAAGSGSLTISAPDAFAGCIIDYDFEQVFSGAAP